MKHDQKREKKSMELNKVIKKQRNHLGLTQEKVAIALGVSASAVYKWEKGLSCPDITLLAPLARLLKTDINNLLAFEEDLTPKEIGDFADCLSQVAINQGIEEGFTLAEEKLRHYPSSDTLYYTVAIILQGSLLLSTKEKKEKSAEEKYQQQIKTIEEWLLKAANSNEANVRELAQKSLIDSYLNKGEYKKAQNILEEIYESTINKKELQAKIFLKEGHYEESKKMLEELIFKTGFDAYQHITLLMTIALKEKDIKKAKALNEKLIAVVQTFDQWPYNQYVGTLEIAIEEKDREKTFETVEKILLSTEKNWDIGKSVLFEHIHKKTTDKDFFHKIRKMILSSMTQDDELDFLKESPKWDKMIEEYKKEYLP